MVKFYKVEHRYGDFDNWRESIVTSSYERAATVFNEVLNIHGGEIRLVTFTEQDNGDFKVTNEVSLRER